MRFKLHTYLLHILLFVLFFTHSCMNTKKEKNDFTDLSGPYLGQTPPGDEPELFAPGIVSTAMYTRDIAMTPDGNEIYFSVSALGYNLIFFTKQKNGHWSEPAPAPFISDYDKMYYEPHITPDGKRMLFLSNISIEKGKEGRQDIWAIDRIGNSWGKPYNLGAPVCSEGSEFFPSTTRDGTLYFTRAEKGSHQNFIFKSKFIDGKYQEPERLPEHVNCGKNRYNAFIDPDERFIIIPAAGMEDGLGGTDYYISFRDEKDNWSKPVNLGKKVNQVRGAEWSPYVSLDGKYFFFMSSRAKKFNASKGEKPSYGVLKELINGPLNGNSNIYWMKADFLLGLKKRLNK